MRATSFLVILALSSCAFAVKHPAATAGIVGGTLGFTTCEIGSDFDAHGTCGIVGAGAAALLGGAVLLAILAGGEGNTVLTEPVTDEPQRPEPPSIDDPVPAPMVPSPPTKLPLPPEPTPPT